MNMSSRSLFGLFFALLSVAGLAASAVGAVQAASQKNTKLANGVYAVLADAPAPNQLPQHKGNQTVLVYDRKYSEVDRNNPPLYVALDTSSFVPFILAGPPETKKGENGWSLLNVKLAPQHVKTLEDFTRAHLDGRVATVIDGEIITMHKVRSVIRDGNAQVTRCYDNACETLRLKLAGK